MSLGKKYSISYENATSLKVKSICFKLYRTYSNQTPSFRQKLANLFSGLILKDLVQVREKKKKVVSCVFTFSAKRELRPYFHVAVLQWCQKKMYKKRDARGKTFFCQSKPISIAFLPFSLSLLASSSLLQLPIVHKRVCFVNDVNKTTTFFRLVDVFHKNVIKPWN